MSKVGMVSSAHIPTRDLFYVSLINLLNLNLVGMFLARVHGSERLASALGIAAILLTVPIAGVIVLNALDNRAWWTYVLPGTIALFLILTGLLDYGLHSDFRNTRLLWPYIAFFFGSLMLQVGYGFLVELKLGFVTLTTYYACVAASLYEYFKLVRPVG